MHVNADSAKDDINSDSPFENQLEISQVIESQE